VRARTGVLMSEQLRVAVIGGGTGGLCLAHGLRKAGVRVDVYERSRVRTERLQGYRVHINPRGAHALHACLPGDLWDAFVATTGNRDGAFGFLDERLNELVLVEDELTSGADRDPARAHHSVSRITLHQVLSSGLDGSLHYGKEFVRYERTPAGTVRCLFTDGTSAEADVMVGADGGSSRVRRQYLPHAERVDTGIRTIVGKLVLDEETMAWLPNRLYDGANLLLPPKGYGMFFAPHKLVEVSDEFGHFAVADDSVRTDPVLFDNTVSYLMWAFGASPGRFPAGVSLPDLDGKQLRDLVGELVSTWHPILGRIVADSDPGTVSLLPIRSATPVKPWPSTNSTLIGDAIHSMTPMRGIGANVALRDAELLCHTLTAAAQGHRAPVSAIAEYEHQMIAYGFKAVRDSRRSATQFVSENALGRLMFKTVLRTFNRFPALKRRAFSSFGND
jgi:salicylate hydroxylase